MNKKLIILTLMATYSLFGNSKPDHRNITMYREVPQWNYIDSKELPFILTLAALVAKDTLYEFNYHEDDISIMFRVYNKDCFFCLWFCKCTRECEIEFDALDESFDYASFKKMIDFFLTKY